MKGERIIRLGIREGQSKKVNHIVTLYLIGLFSYDNFIINIKLNKINKKKKT